MATQSRRVDTNKTTSHSIHSTRDGPLLLCPSTAISLTVLVTAPDTAGILILFTTKCNKWGGPVNLSSSFAPSCFHECIFRPQVRHADPSGRSRAYCFFACSESGSMSAVPSSVQPLPILRRRGPPMHRQLEISVARTAARTLYLKRNNIFHNAAVNHPRGRLPRAPIVRCRHVHDALHPGSPRDSLNDSSRGSCTLVFVYDMWMEGYASEMP